MQKKDDNLEELKNTDPLEAAEQQAPMEEENQEETELSPDEMAAQLKEMTDQLQEMIDQLEEMKTQLDEEKEQHLRMAAEYDNYRKRTQREREGLYSDAKALTLTSLLPVLDNFERAMTGGGQEEDFRKGIEMIFTQLNEVLQKLGVESFCEVGEQFDPNIHNAVISSADDAAEENSITQVLQKGYKLGDKILRPAMVAVKN